MAFRCMSRSFPLLTCTGALVGQARPALPRKFAPCSGVRRLSVFGSSEENAPRDDPGSKIEVSKDRSRPPASRRSNALRRAPARDLDPSSFLDIWDPFVGSRSLKQMLNTVDRLFDPFWGSAAPAAVAVDFRTPWDVKEDDDAFRLRLDMPGLSKDEVKVSIEDGDLVIKGEHKAEDQKEDSWSSRSYGSYHTRMTLPDNAKVEEVKAELKNGVLHVAVPKSKEAPKNNVVDIKVE